MENNKKMEKENSWSQHKHNKYLPGNLLRISTKDYTNSILSKDNQKHQQCLKELSFQLQKAPGNAAFRIWLTTVVQSVWGQNQLNLKLIEKSFAGMKET